MTDYTNYIEESLNKLMPQELLMEAKNDNGTATYVKDAPKVKGYFKFISVRYMKRVKDIKKMCVEYINTYVESALNVAKNMDDVRIVDEQNKDTLAKDVDFAKVGASTNGEKKNASNKEGVLFLTGDKALMDKINAIIEKINLRAKKSNMLMEWASLMITQSKIIANEIIRKETTKLLKEEKLKKEQEKKNEEKHKKEQERLEAMEKEREAAQKTNSALASDYGEPTELIKDAGLTAKAIKKMLEGIGKGELEKALADDEGNLDVSNELNKRRMEFYKKTGAEQTVEDAVKFANEGDDNKVKNFRFATYMVEQYDGINNKKSLPSPIDVMIATVNNESVMKSVAEQVREPIGGIKIEDFKVDINAGEALGEDKYVKADYTHKCAYLYLSMLSKENAVLENAGSVYTSEQFIAEQVLNGEKEKLEDKMMIADVLSDYDYQLNLGTPHKFKNGMVTFVKLDDNGEPVFYNGEYGTDNIVELTDEELHEIAYYIINNF